MATPTYIALATATLASSASSFTFSSIDQSYGDLVLVANYNPSTQGGHRLTLNNDNNSNYNMAIMTGFSGNASSVARNNQSFFLNEVSDAGWHLNTYRIFDYSATDKHKSLLLTYNHANERPATEHQSGRYASNSAVTSVTMFLNGGSFDPGSTFSLYGVAK